MMTTDPVGNIQAIEKLIPKNAQVMQAVQTHTLKQSMDASEAALLQLLQSVRPGIGQNVNVKA
ncbi:MAG: YjfB family protein [Thermomicrobiales bacterium]